MLHLLFYVNFGLLDFQIYNRPLVAPLAASVTGAAMSWEHRYNKLSGPDVRSGDSMFRALGGAEHPECLVGFKRLNALVTTLSMI